MSQVFPLSVQICSTRISSYGLHFSYFVFFHMSFFLSPYTFFCLTSTLIRMLVLKSSYETFYYNTCFFFYIFVPLTFRPWTIKVQETCLVYLCTPTVTDSTWHISRYSILFVDGKNKTFQSHPGRSYRSYLCFHSICAFSYYKIVSKMIEFYYLSMCVHH